jgi:hypothetical protein
MDHLTQEQIERYRRGQLVQAQSYREVDEHVATCNYCRERLLRPAEPDATPQTLSRLMDGPVGDYCHPSPDLLADYVRRPSEVAPLAAAHIRACERCQEDLAALRSYLSSQEEKRPSRRWFGRFGTARARLVFGGALALAVIAIVFVLYKNRPVAVLYDGGGRWTLDAWGHLTGPVALSPALEEAQTRALQESALEAPTAILAALRGRSQTLLHPVATVILSDRPTLEWKPPAAATPGTRYVCRIVAISKPGFRRPPSKPVSKPFWTLPAKKPPLPRGELYTWQVIAKTDGKSRELTGAIATLPKFKVLEQERVVALETAKRTYGRSHLTMLLLYTREGLLDEADRELAALQQANPGSRQIQALQARLNALRGATS